MHKKHQPVTMADSTDAIAFYNDALYSQGIVAKCGASQSPIRK